MDASGSQKRLDSRFIARGGAWNALGWIVTLATGPPLTIALVRSMSHASFGVLSIATAIVGPASALAALGLGPAMSQLGAAEATRTGDQGLLNTLAAGLNAARRALPWIAVGCCALLGVVGATRSLRDAVVPFAAMLPMVLAAAIRSLFDGFLRATGSAVWLGLSMAVSAIATGALVLILVLHGQPTATWVAASRSVGFVVSLTILIVGVRQWRRDHPVVATMVPQSRSMLGVSVAMLLTGLGWLIISQLDLLILGVDRGTASVGLYAPASRLADIALALAGVVGSFLLPALAASVARGEGRQTSHLYHWSSRWALFVAVPVIAPMIIVPGPTLDAVFGGGFASVAVAARILGCGALVHVLFGFNGFTLEAHGLAVPTAARSGIGIVVSVVLCLILIPRYGANGAAVATTAAIGVVNLLCSVSLWRRFRIPPWDASFGAVIAAAAVGIAAAAVVQQRLDGAITKCLAVALVTVGLTAVGLVLGRTARTEDVV